MEPLTMTWWMWLAVGLVLMMAELLLPTGFFLLFFGGGALATAVLVRLGVSSFVTQGLAFLAISALCVILLRKPLLARFHFRNHAHHAVDSLIGENARALEPIAPLAIGKVEMRRASWSALNTGSEMIPLDFRCRVEK